MTNTKTCTKCRQELPLDRFSPDRKSAGGRRSRCRACRSESARQERKDNPEPSRAASRKYRTDHPEKRLAQGRRHRDRLRDQVFDHYGRACACCGTTEDLTADHVDGNGRAHRIELFGRANAAGKDFWRWLVSQGFPPGFQTLCRPCNRSKGTGLRCKLEQTADEAA